LHAAVTGRRYVAATLAKMATVPAIKAEMLAKDFLPALLKALEGSGDLPKYAAGALAVFVAGEKAAAYGAEVAETEAVTSLISLLSSKERWTQCTALWALTELAHCKALNEKDALQLVPYLKRSYLPTAKSPNTYIPPPLLLTVNICIRALDTFPGHFYISSCGFSLSPCCSQFTIFRIW
jgi:hypothetical protein